MTRSELAISLAARFPALTVKDTEIVVREILDAIGHAMVQGNRVEIRGFGSFRLNYRAPRVGRNPKSGETVLVPEKYVPHFKPGKELCDRVEQSAAILPLQRAA